MKLIKIYTEHSDVKVIQQMLKELGYYTGSIDSKFGNKSEKATKDFQKSYGGLTVDGIVGEKTLNALKNAIKKKNTPISTPNSNSIQRNIKIDFPYMRGDDVKAVQNMLKSLGYNVGSVDGVYGTKTEDAVKSFQQKYRLNIDGIVGKNTWGKLLEVTSATPTPSPTPEPVKPNDFYKQLIVQAENYAQKHKPNNGYTVNAMKAICNANLPSGTNLMIQFLLQFDGKETIQDLVSTFDEKRLPYGDNRSMDDESDCSSLMENLFDIFFGFDIGNYTEAQWKNYKHNKVDFNNLRPCDLIFWNFKASQGRTVSHVAMYIGDGKIFHTTSKSNPARVDNATYSSSSRVGCARVLSDEQYNSLLVK